MDETTIERLAKAAYVAQYREHQRGKGAVTVCPYESLDEKDKAVLRAIVKALFKEYSSILKEEKEQRRLSRDYDRWRNTDTGPQKVPHV